MFIAFFVIVVPCKQTSIRIWRNKFKRIRKTYVHMWFGKSVKVILSIKVSYDGIFSLILFCKTEVYIKIF